MSSIEFPVGSENGTESVGQVDWNGGLIALCNEVYPAIISDEKENRRAAFRNLTSALIVYEEFCDENTGLTQSLHKTFLESPLGDTAERTIFAGSTLFPDHGKIFRVIINDTYPDAECAGGRYLYAQDFVISLLGKAITRQSSITHRERSEDRWMLASVDGPRIQEQNGRVTILAGDEYSMHLPRSRGYPYSLVDCMRMTDAARIVNKVIGALDVSSFQPEATNSLGIL